MFATEAPESFVGFGAPILAPTAGVVVVAVDGCVDHSARRSPFALVPYALGQAGRVREGGARIAGNHVIIASGTDRFVLLAHLRRGSVTVRAGERVSVGDEVGHCGNSGNSTEPHVHVQVTDSMDWRRAAGLPMSFRRPGAAGGVWIPEESEIVDAS